MPAPEPTNTTNQDILAGQLAAEITSGYPHSGAGGIVSIHYPFANANYALRTAQPPYLWKPLPDDPNIPARRWLRHLDVWPTNRPSPPGVLWRASAPWPRGTWPPPLEDEISLTLSPLKDWLEAIPYAPETPTRRYIISLSTEIIGQGRAATKAIHSEKPTGRPDIRLPVFAQGLGKARTEICVTENPVDALALHARGARVIAIGNFGGQRKNSSLGSHMLKELIKNLVSIADQRMTIFAKQETSPAGLERIVNETGKIAGKKPSIKRIPADWRKFTDDDIP